MGHQKKRSRPAKMLPWRRAGKRPVRTKASGAIGREKSWEGGWYERGELKTMRSNALDLAEKKGHGLRSTRRV